MQLAFARLFALNRRFETTDSDFCALATVTHSMINRTAVLAKCTRQEEQQRFGVLAHFPDVFSKLSAKHSSRIESNLSNMHLLWYTILPISLYVCCRLSIASYRLRQNLEAIQSDMNATFHKVWQQYESEECDFQRDCERS